MKLREKYALYGPHHLSDAETLALVIGAGCAAQSAYGIALALLAHFDGLHRLSLCEPHELEAIQGIGKVKATQVHAALQLGRRLLRSQPLSSTPFLHPHQVASLLAPTLYGLAHEELHALYLNRAHHQIALRRLSQGTDSATLIDPKQVFRPAITLRASAVIIAHNHPSGCSVPSENDRDITQRLQASGELLGIMLLDHLIVGAASTYSIRQNCDFPHAW